MEFVVNANKYEEIVNTVYNLIDKELTSNTDLQEAYPRFLIMYEFFRMLRGEAFSDYREPVGKEFQDNMYKMEDDILRKIKELKTKIPPDEPKAKYYFDNIITPSLRI